MTRRIVKEDLRALGYCHAGARLWAAAHGINWQDFLKNGIAIEELERFDDLLAARVVEHVKKGEAHGRQE